MIKQIAETSRAARPGQERADQMARRIYSLLGGTPNGLDRKTIAALLGVTTDRINARCTEMIEGQCLRSTGRGGVLKIIGPYNRVEKTYQSYSGVCDHFFAEHRDMCVGKTEAAIFIVKLRKIWELRAGNESERTEVRP